MTTTRLRGSVPNASKKHADVLLNGDIGSKLDMFRNHELDEDLMNRVISGKDILAKQILIEHQKLSDRLIAEASKDPRLRELILIHQSLSAELATDAINDADPYIRAAVLENPNAPLTKDQVIVAAQDPDSFVRNTANYRLRELEAKERKLEKKADKKRKLDDLRRGACTT